ncbi:MAG: hypothetical protein GXP54_04240, partial [Deltaproteobacteria bacterium]|nr:hypothetical protein [Deltaproteobacteria bacterium]
MKDDDADKVTLSRTRLLNRFETGGSGGIATSSALTRVMDRYLKRRLRRFATPGCGWSIMAVGSYGRRELSFASDVDCVLLHKGPEPVDAVGALEKAVLELWNSGIHASVAVYRLDKANRL